MFKQLIILLILSLLILSGCQMLTLTNDVGVMSDQNSDCASQVEKATKYCNDFSQDDCNHQIPSEVGLRVSNVSCDWNGQRCRAGFACL